MNKSVFASTATLLVPAAAFAQNSTSAAVAESRAARPGNATADVPHKDTTGIVDIIVTAQHGAGGSQRAAIAIDVVTGGTVAAAGISNANDSSKLGPSLTIQSIGPMPTRPRNWPAVAVIRPAMSPRSCQGDRPHGPGRGNRRRRLTRFPWSAICQPGAPRGAVVEFTMAPTAPMISSAIRTCCDGSLDGSRPASRRLSRRSMQRSTTAPFRPER